MIICGCSWMYPDYTPEFQGSHFSEILAKEIGYELIVNSMSGSSNGGICVQIEDAIKQKPDLILFGQTVPDRVEISISDELLSFGNYKRDVTTLVELKDLLKYGDDPIILSDNLHGLLLDEDFEVGSLRHKPKSWRKERYSALKNWFMYNYSPTMKRQIDVWCLYAVQHKLHMSGIPAIKVIDLLNYDTPWYSSCTKDLYKPLHYVAPENSGQYHTNKEIQLNIVDDIKSHISAEYKYITGLKI